MYPPLPSPQDPGPAPMATPLPQGQILYKRVYYMPVPAPHNVVVAQSAIPAPTKVPRNAEIDETAQELSDSGVNSKPNKVITAPTEEVPPLEEPQRIDEPQRESSITTTCSEPKVGSEFAMPAVPPPSKKEAKRPRGQSRSPSHSRSNSRHCEELRSSTTGLEPSTNTLRRNRGKGKRSVEMSSSPLLAPTVRSHLGHITRPKDGVTITVRAEDGLHLSEVHLPLTPVLGHMTQLDHEVAQPMDLLQDSQPRPNTTVEFPQEPLHEDSDVDLETGEIRIPMVSQPTALKMTYNARLALIDHQDFTSSVLLREPDTWDHLQVDRNPSQFDQEYFMDQQKINDVRSRGHSRIQAFNIRITRQEPQSPAHWVASSKAGKEKLEAKFRQAFASLYDAFKAAYQFEHSEFISDLRNHLVKTAVTQITSLFASSRCRTCY